MPATAVFSVIVPTLQEEILIERTLRQFTPELREHHGIEVIVSDGGSSDATISIARRYADRVIVGDPPPQGISIGRNLGAATARGSILVFLNADTLLSDPEEFFRYAYDAVHRPGIAAATCDVFVYPEEECVADRFAHRFYNRYFRLLNTLGMGMGRGECHVIRKELFHAVGGYNARIAAGEDYDLFLRLRRRGGIAVLNTVRVFESPRRYRRYGYLRITVFWFINACSVFLFHRSLHRQWKPVR